MRTDQGGGIKVSSARKTDKSDSSLSLWMVNQYAATREMSSGTRHVELARLLARNGWRVKIFASQNNRAKSDSFRSDPDLGLFRWVYTFPFKSNGLARYVNALSFLASSLLAMVIRPKPDVIIGSSPHLLAAFGALFIAKIKRIPFVLEIRDMWPDSLIQLGLTNSLIIKPLEYIERLLYRESDAIIALTEGIRSRIVDKGVDEQKIELIPNASMKPPPLDSELRALKRDEFGWSDKIVVLWVGAHNLANGLEYVIDAAKLLHDRTDILFVFIGRGTEKARLMERAAGTRNIEFWNPVPKSEVAEIMRSGDIGILNSKAFDAFDGARPNKLFEYMANGLAIVNAIPGEASRLVQEGGAGIDVIWENPTSIAEGIRELADNEQRRNAMASSGHSYVATHHSREHTAEVLNRLLNNILKEKRHV